jgi:hydrogenase maturation factor
MRVIECAPGLAVCVTEAGTRTDVMTDLVEPVACGDMLLVHAGTALGRAA